MLIYCKDGGPYIAGSVHFLPEYRPEIPPQLVELYENTGCLVLECKIDDYDGSLRLLPEGESLDHLISPDSYERVIAAARTCLLDAQELRDLKPWACILRLVRAALEAKGFSFAGGIDSYFRERAIREGKSVFSLEHSDTVDRLLDVIPLQQQEGYLNSFIEEDLEGLSRNVERLIQAWRIGDAASIEHEWLSRMPLRDLLISTRNRMWISAIERGCQEQPDALVLVGVTHLVGPGNLIRLLRSRGIRFNRL